MARHHRADFEALKANEKKREAMSAHERESLEIVRWTLSEYGFRLSNRAEVALRLALQQGAVPYVNTADDQLWSIHPDRLSDSAVQELWECRGEIVDQLTICSRAIPNHRRIAARLNAIKQKRENP